jgi:hypothetical protein
MVLSQALASGLPVICTDRTGGKDLAHTPALARRIMVIPNNDLAALVAAISELRGRLEMGKYFPPLADSDRETLSWAAYGRRYAKLIAADFGQCSRAERLPEQGSVVETLKRSGSLERLDHRDGMTSESHLILQSPKALALECCVWDLAKRSHSVMGARAISLMREPRRLHKTR